MMSPTSSHPGKMNTVAHQPRKGSRPAAPGCSGFSLLDVVVSISLSAILLAVAVPKTADLLDSYRLASASKQIALEISRVRNQAVSQNVSIRMRFTDSTHYVVERSEGESFVQVGQVQPLPPGIAVRGYANDGLLFNRLGIATSRAVLIVENLNASQTIEMSPLGRVTVN